MEFQKDRIDASSVTWATDQAKYYAEESLKLAVKLTQDPDKIARLAKSECMVCYYAKSARIGGASMTTKPCGLCDRIMDFCNTNTDKVCVHCARVHDLCKHCGADIKLRVRRVFDGKKVGK